MTSRNTIPIITKYELTSLLATRTAEIANGEPSTIQNPGTTNPIEIALLEYKAGKIPNKICRTWPDGNVEIWGLHELHSLK